MPNLALKKRSLILGMSIENVLEISNHPISSSKGLCSTIYFDLTMSILLDD